MSRIKQIKIILRPDPEFDEENTKKFKKLKKALDRADANKLYEVLCDGFLKKSKNKTIGFKYEG